MASKRALTLPELAAELGISERQAFRLVSDGVLIGKASRYDLAVNAVRYVRHVTKDADGRRARSELARVESARKRLQLRKQLGQLFGPDEFVQASDRQFELMWQAWQRAAAWMHGELSLALPASDALRVANQIDMDTKAYLVESRNEWRAKWIELRDAAKDQQRVDGLLRELIDPNDDGGTDGQ